jgi:hypothetical protein
MNPEQTDSNIDSDALRALKGAVALKDLQLPLQAAVHAAVYGSAANRQALLKLLDASIQQLQDIDPTLNRAQRRRLVRQGRAV